MTKAAVRDDCGGPRRDPVRPVSWDPAVPAAGLRWSPTDLVTSQDQTSPATRRPMASAAPGPGPLPGLRRDACPAPSLVPPRRAYSTEVVRTALLAAAQGAGYARAAAAAGAPTSTVRDWLRAVGRSAPALTAQAVMVAGAAGEADACWPRRSRPCTALISAVNALAAAVRAFHLTLTRPRFARATGAGTGIDYLAILAERHRRQLLHDLRLADPTSAASDLSPWQTINILTAGRL